MSTILPRDEFGDAMETSKTMFKWWIIVVVVVCVLILACGIFLCWKYRNYTIRKTYVTDAYGNVTVVTTAEDPSGDPKKGFTTIQTPGGDTLVSNVAGGGTIVTAPPPTIIAGGVGYPVVGPQPGYPVGGQHGYPGMGQPGYSMQPPGMMQPVQPGYGPVGYAQQQPSPGSPQHQVGPVGGMHHRPGGPARPGMVTMAARAPAASPQATSPVGAVSPAHDSA